MVDIPDGWLREANDAYLRMGGGSRKSGLKRECATYCRCSSALITKILRGRQRRTNAYVFRRMSEFFRIPIPIASVAAVMHPAEMRLLEVAGRVLELDPESGEDYLESLREGMENYANRLARKRGSGPVR